jgi:RNA polymerase subunit RPABC4/transcription elongation factor Spt4
MNDDLISNAERKVCPTCGSEEFVTEPNRYDILTFDDDFEVSKSYFIDEYSVQAANVRKILTWKTQVV